MWATDLRTFSWSYHQRGIVATVQTERPNDTAWQRFLGTGPLALLPVRGRYSNVVWSTTVAEASRLEALSPEEFALNVNQVGEHGIKRSPVLCAGFASTSLRYTDCRTTLLKMQASAST